MPAESSDESAACMWGGLRAVSPFAIYLFITDRATAPFADNHLCSILRL